MKIPPYVTFDIKPWPLIAKPRQGLTMKYDLYVKYLNELAIIAKAKRFKLSDNFKVIFILPISDKITPQQQMELVGEPHLTGKHQLTRLIKAFTTALRGEGDLPSEDFFRIDASKYWGPQGKIIVRNIITPDFDYLRQIK